jgi:hypothetical protein
MDERAKQNSPEPSVDTELESWNPMAEDFSNLAFNAYREPTTEELRHWMPKYVMFINPFIIYCTRHMFSDWSRACK